MLVLLGPCTSLLHSYALLTTTPPSPLPLTPYRWANGHIKATLVRVWVDAFSKIMGSSFFHFATATTTMMLEKAN